MRFNKIWFDPVLAVVLLSAFLSLFVVPHAARAEGTKAGGVHKVVFQVSDNDPKKWNLTLNNVMNVQKAVGKDKVRIEIVAYGPGINMLKLGSEVGGRIDEAVNNGVGVVACENTMKGMHLTKADMLPSISYVPGGVVELIEKQEQGFAYIKP